MSSAFETLFHRLDEITPAMTKHTLQSSHTPIVVDLLPEVSEQPSLLAKE